MVRNNSWMMLNRSLSAAQIFAENILAQIIISSRAPKWAPVHVPPPDFLTPATADVYPMTCRGIGWYRPPWKSDLDPD